MVVQGFCACVNLWCMCVRVCVCVCTCGVGSPAHTWERSMSAWFLSELPDTRALCYPQGWIQSSGLGGSTSILRQLWLPCHLDFGSLLWHLLHFLSFPKSSFSLVYLSSFHRLPGDLLPNHPDHIFLQWFLDTKTRLSMAGWTTDSWLGQWLWQFHMPMALVQGKLQQQGADGRGKVIPYILH